jgi:hypothetical protein
MRVLGDEYVKSEFRAHRNVDNPIHIVSHHHVKSFRREAKLDQKRAIVTDWEARSGSLQNGKDMHNKSKVKSGEERRWTRRRLTR